MPDDPTIPQPPPGAVSPASVPEAKASYGSRGGAGQNAGQNALADLHLALAFLTRLPVPELGLLPPGALARAMGLFPLAGAVVGALGAAAYALAAAVALPPLLAAPLAVAVMILATGGLHEDGLADLADGFGGGADKEAKLRIMKDSRIGSYGVLALGLALLLRIGALASLARPGAVAAALVAAHALSRAALPVVLRLLPPARESGLGASAGRPAAATAALAAASAGLAALLLLPAGTALAAGAAAAAGTALMVRLARRQIGGHTGDVLGGVQQVAEIGALLAVVALR